MDYYHEVKKMLERYKILPDKISSLCERIAHLEEEVDMLKATDYTADKVQNSPSSQVERMAIQIAELKIQKREAEWELKTLDLFLPYLKKEHQDIIEMYYLKDMSINQIRNKLHIERATCYTKLADATRELTMMIYR